MHFWTPILHVSTLDFEQMDKHVLSSGLWRIEMWNKESGEQRSAELWVLWNPPATAQLPPRQTFVASRGANPTFCVPKRPKAQVLRPPPRTLTRPPLPQSDRSAYLGSKLPVTVEEEGDLAIHPTAGGFAGHSLFHGGSTFRFFEEEIPQFCGSGGATWASSSVCVFQPREKESSSVGPLSSTLTNTYKHSIKKKKNQPL